MYKADYEEFIKELAQEYLVALKENGEQHSDEALDEFLSMEEARGFEGRKFLDLFRTLEEFYTAVIATSESDEGDEWRASSSILDAIRVAALCCIREDIKNKI